MAEGNSSNANRYKGEDIDQDGDGQVDNADQLDGQQGSHYEQKADATEPLVLENRTSDPSNPDIGELWIRTDL